MIYLIYARRFCWSPIHHYHMWVWVWSSCQISQNLTFGGSSLKHFTFFWMLNIALRAFVQINEEFSENMSWFLLFIERTTVPKYLNCRTCSIGLPLKFISTLSSAPKHIDFVLISITMTLLLAQNFRRRSNCLWRPFAESENKMRSSAHKMCAMMTCFMTTPNFLNG